VPIDGAAPQPGKDEPWPAHHGMTDKITPLYVVCSPCRSVGKTLVSRLLTEFYVVNDRPVAAFDLADEGPQLTDYLPDITTIADISDTRGAPPTLVNRKHRLTLPADLTPPTFMNCVSKFGSDRTFPHVIAVVAPAASRCS
jgi:hypothetical protein